MRTPYHTRRDASAVFIQTDDVWLPDPRLSGGRRMLDLIGSTIAGVALAPVYILVAVLIRCTSRGPAIFRQVRVGEDGAPFTLYKFRTMRAGTTGREISVPGDDRRTRVGRWLRFTSLDELPQLLNVLRGDMTLVGPRPETPALAARYVSGCKVIFRYRPGLTGVAQIRLRDRAVLGNANDVEQYYLTRVVPQRVALELEFQRDATLRRTLGVLIETAKYLIRSSLSRAAGSRGVGTRHCDRVPTQDRTRSCDLSSE